MQDKYPSPPFVNNTNGVINITIWMVSSLTLLAGLYSFFYAPAFILKFSGFVLLGLVLEISYFLIKDGKFKIKSGGSMITAGILILCIPPDMPFIPLIFSLIVAIIFVKLPCGESSIRFNPALTARLFLMLAYKNEIVSWVKKGIDTDVISTATPLELFQSEGASLEILKLLSGKISGNWEELYELVAGSPGEIFTPVILIIGIVLYFRGILDIRPGISFIISFAATMLILGQPVFFNILSGAVIFSAVFIATDPKSTPVTPLGKYFAGIIAGIVNALIRNFTFYSEGIAFSFLLVNLLTPQLDNLAFYLKSRSLLKKKM